MPTATRLHAERRGVFVACAGCRRGRRLDLEALIAAGQGEAEIQALCDQGRFKCGYCGVDRVTLHVDSSTGAALGPTDRERLPAPRAGPRGP